MGRHKKELGSSENKAEEVKGDIIVGDPQELRPVELPLVVKPVDGKWANEAQEKFARTLNGYAYKNPKKWKIKKDILISQLKDLEKNPENLSVLQGGDNPNLSFKNRLIDR